MPKYVITPKVEHLHIAADKMPAGVDQAQINANEYNSLEGAQAMAERALQIYPNQPRMVSEIKLRLSGTVQIATAIEAVEAEAPVTDAKASK